MKIYDCFTFYNELDLLEIRLNTLYDHVDHFVLVEANTTYTSRPKPFFFEENRQRYKQFWDKIIHIKVEDMPGDPDAWVNDRFQRNQIWRGIKDADLNDIIVVSDLDEIVRPEAMNHIRSSEMSVWALRMTLHNFKFNYMKQFPDVYSPWAMAGRRHLFNMINPDSFRQVRFQFFDRDYQFRDDGCEVVEHGGWHFGYMGDKTWLLDKAVSFAHTEVNTPEFLAQIDPEASIAKKTSWQQNSNDKYEVVDLDDYFPKYIIDNKEKFKDFILPDSGKKALDFLPPFPYNS